MYRHHRRWGAQALEHLIEIYISPNGDHLWEVVTSPQGGEGSTESLEIARFFLSELQKISRGDSRSGAGATGGTNKAAIRLRYAAFGTALDPDTDIVTGGLLTHAAFGVVRSSTSIVFRNQLVARTGVIPKRRGQGCKKRCNRFLLLFSNHSRCVCFGRYLESAVKMMARDKESVDAAMTGFMSMLEDDKENVPALLGMSLAFTLEDSPNKVGLRFVQSSCVAHVFQDALISAMEYCMR